MNEFVGTPGRRSESKVVDYSSTEAPRPRLDLFRIWSAIFRNRIAIIVILVTALLSALAISVFSRPQYEARAAIQIDQQAAKVLQTEDSDNSPQLGDNERFLQTQIDVLTSRTIALRVSDILGLARNDNFVIGMGDKPVTEPDGALNLRDAKREQVIELLRDNLTVMLPRNSRVATVKFRSPNALMSARVLNSFVDSFITANLQRRYDTTAYARNFLQGRLADTRNRLQDSERALIGYARSAQLIDASNAPSGTTAGDGPATPRSLTIARLVQLDTALTQAQATRIASEERWKQAQKTPLMSLPEVLANSAVQQLTQQRAALAASYTEERQRRKADYPSMIQAAARIIELGDQIQRLAASVRESIHNSYQTAASQEQALRTNVAKMKNETLAEQDRSIQYNILRREVDTNRTLYDGLLQRYKEVSAQAGIATNNLTVIDRAEVPALPVSPRPRMNLAIALVIGMMIAALFVLARERFDDIIRTVDDVPQKLDQPLLATIPILDPDRTPVEELQNLRSPISEAYNSLRTALELSTPNGAPKSLLVTSSRPSEGKSTTAYAIARAFARGGKQVIIVDGDLRKPSLHRMFGDDNAAGLSSLIVGQIPLVDVVRRSDISGLDFVTSGPSPPNAAELLGSPGLRTTLENLKHLYDIIVFDGPPIMGLADAAVLGSVADGTVFVVEANGSRYGGVKAGLRRLTSNRANVLGIVLTKLDMRRLGYGQEYSAQYSYGHSAEQN